MLDVRQAEQLVSTAAETIQIWSVALSSRKTSSARFSETTLAHRAGTKLTEQPHVPRFRGLPPACWTKTDIREAEAQLIRPNAQIWGR